MPVRTKCLAAVKKAAAGVAVLYTCPAGETAIVKEVAFYNAGGATQTYSAAFRRAGLPDIYWHSSSAASGGVGISSRWSVLHPGDQIVMNSSGVDMCAWISGTELEGLAD